MRWRGPLLVSLSLLSAIGAVWLGPVGTARADGLVSFEITTAGRALQVFNDDGTGARAAEVDVPESSADLREGPLGRAFSSIVWPGPIAGNLGTLLRVLQPSLPPSVSALNDPVRAEAATGQDPPTSTFSLPDVSMTATASDQLVEARATVGTLSGDAGPTSGFSSFGSARLRNGRPYATASSSASGLSIAGGVVKIGAVTSTATATSDGTSGAGAASTEVAGLTIAGQRVAVDDRGLHLGSVDTPLNQMVNQVVDRALSSAGIEISLGVPTRTIHGAAVTMVAPALVVTIKSSSGVVGLVLGGAQVSVSGVADTSGPAAPADGAPSTTPGSSTAATGNGVLPALLSPTVSSWPPVPTATTARPAPVDVRTAAPIVSAGHRLHGGAVALALLAVALLAGGLGELWVHTIGREREHCPNGAARP